MDYHSIKQKMVRLLFILAFGCSVLNATPVSVQSDAALHAVQEKLGNPGNPALVQQVHQLLKDIDKAIFQYLHYEGQEKNYAAHITKFKSYLATLKCIIHQHEKHPGCSKAMSVLHEMQKAFAALVKDVAAAQGSKGLVAAMDLGRKIGPSIKAFKKCFPSIQLTVDDEISNHYKIAVNELVILNHLQKRLEA